MSKFNNDAKSIKTENHCGHVAYSMDDKSKLITQVLTSFFNEKKFYGDNSDEIIETVDRVIKTDPKFVSNLAIFARREFNMRSISHVLTAQLAHAIEGKPFVKRTLKGIVLRGDDATEVLSCYLGKYGKPIPNSLRKGLRDIFTTFDAYTLAKYKGTGKEVKMRDILCLCHPSPENDKQSETWKKLLEDRLEAPYTWEVELSAKGNNQQTWEALIDSGKVGYMALLRNLRNILAAEPQNLDRVLDHISNPEAVRNSKQLPFRYLSAYKAVQDTCGSKVLNALEQAAAYSVDNLPKIPGRTLIAIDSSGSMDSWISQKSKVSCYEIATMLGLIANRLCEDAYVCQFDTHIYPMHIPANVPLISTVISQEGTVGGTDIGQPFHYLMSRGIRVDRVIILSDNECNTGITWWRHTTVQSLADQYRKQTGNDIWVHAIDLQGYGTQQFTGKKTNIIAGWSEKIFEFIILAEKGEGTLLKRIEEYTFN